MNTHADFDNLKVWLESQGYSYVRDVPGYGVCALYPFIFTWGIVVDIDRTGYSHRYCYHDLLHAKAAYENWTGDGEPIANGFIKRK